MAKSYWPWCDDSLKVDDSLVKYSSRRTGYRAGGVDSIGRFGKLGPRRKSMSTKSRSRLSKVESSLESIGSSGSVPMRLINLHEEQLHVKP